MAALTEIVREAADVMAAALPVRTIEENGVILTFRRTHFDRDGEYFGYVALNEEEVPWKGDRTWEGIGGLLELSEISLRPLSEAFGAVLGVLGA